MTKLAYVMSRFPKLTETFVLYEILELKRTAGLEIEVFPIIEEKTSVHHAEVREILPHVHFAKLTDGQTLAAQFHWLARQPGQYIRLLWQVLWGHRQSINFLLRTIMIFPLAVRFAKEMQATEVEHIHIHYATHPMLVGYIVNQLTGISYSITAHAHDIYVDRTFLRQKLESCAVVVTISKFNRQFLIRHYGDTVADKIRVIHCGIDPDVFTPRDPVHNDVFTVASIASLQPYKGHRYLIEACKILKDEGFPIRAILVGDGELRAELEAIVSSLGLTEIVTFKGGLPRAEVKAILQQVDAMIMTSIIDENGKMEGIPVALMEAMATTIPVIATRISGIPELVVDGETGLLVPQKDPVATAEALKTLANDPQQARALAERAREKVLAEFNLHHNTTQLSKLLLEQVNPAQHRPSG